MRPRPLVTLLLFLLALIPPFAVASELDAQPSPDSGAVIADAELPPAPVVISPSAPSSAPSSVVASLDDVPVAEAMAFYHKAHAAFDGPTVLGICAALACLVGLLTWGLRRFGGHLLSQPEMNRAGMVLGALAGGLSSVTPQMPWWGACFAVLMPLVVTLSPGHKGPSSGN